MKKRIVWLLALVFLLSGCGVQSAPTETTAEPTVATTMETQSVVPVDPAARAAYRAALERLVNDRILPGGGEAQYVEDYGPMSDNRFAVTDLDGDGEEELLLFFTTSYMAGMCTGVYGFDPETGDLRTELLEWPGLTFYTNGLVKADASHNHGKAGDAFWPCRLYAYNAETDTYDGTFYLDAWDRQYGDTDYEGNPFPEDVDTEKTGVVFLVYEKEWGGPCETLSKSAFEAWYSDYLGDGEAMIIPYEDLTAENIAKLTA